jgi:hypothetical protein
MAYMSKSNQSLVKGGRQARTRRAGAEQRNQASIKSAAINLFKGPEGRSVESATRSG